MRLQITALLLLSGLAGLAIAAPPAAADGDILLIERVQLESTALPARGLSMAQVQARYGAPSRRLEPRGGQSRAWPTINRWSYPSFTVYFEKDRVIDAVANKASASEIGPKPAIQ